MWVATAAEDRSGVCEQEGQGADGRLMTQRTREHRGQRGA